MSDPLRLLVVGCGSITKAWFPALLAREDATIVALADLNEEAARQRKEEHGLREAATGSDFAALIDAHKPDVVCDCTVPAAHHEVVSTALGRGCHVLGEKPMAETLGQARELVAAAREAGRLHAVIQNRRYLPGIRTVRAALREGLIGEVHTLNADFYVAPHFGGFREQMPHVLLSDMAIHSFDQARYVSGTDPHRVFCHEYNPPGSWYAHDASAQAIFTMSDGVVFNYRGSWCATGLSTSWECQWRIIGSKGTLLWDGNEGIQCEVEAGESSTAFFRPTRTVEVTRVDVPPERRAHAGIIHDFLDCVRAADGSEPLTVGHDNIHSLAMVTAAIESAGRGQPVTVGR